MKLQVRSGSVLLGCNAFSLTFRVRSWVRGGALSSLINTPWHYDSVFRCSAHSVRQKLTQWSCGRTLEVRKTHAQEIDTTLGPGWLAGFARATNMSNIHSLTVKNQLVFPTPIAPSCTQARSIGFNPCNRNRKLEHNRGCTC